MMPEKSKKKPEIKRIPMPIEWRIGEGITTNFVTNLTVQCSEHETVISFFELKPPILLGTAKENEVTLKNAKSIRADCVSRIAIPTSRLPEFIQAIRTGFENHVKAQEQIAALMAATNGENK